MEGGFCSRAICRSKHRLVSVAHGGPCVHMLLGLLGPFRQMQGKILRVRSSGPKWRMPIRRRPRGHWRPQFRVIWSSLGPNEGDEGYGDSIRCEKVSPVEASFLSSRTQHYSSHLSNILQTIMTYEDDLWNLAFSNVGRLHGGPRNQRDIPPAIQAISGIGPPTNQQCQWTTGMCHTTSAK